MAAFNFYEIDLQAVAGLIQFLFLSTFHSIWLLWFDNP